MKLEIRNYKCTLAVRSGEEKESRTITGRAAPYNRSTEIAWFTEEIAPGAFRESIESRNVYALVGHSSTHPVASTAAGSLRFVEKEDGLYLEMEPAETSYGNDLLMNVRGGLVEHLSVGMNILDFDKQERDSKEHYVIRKAELWEVSAVVWPAYKDTSLSEKRDIFTYSRQARKKQLEKIKRQVSIDSEYINLLELECS